MSESMGDFWIRKIGDFREGRIKACPVCERAPAPATPAATPLREANQQRVDAAAQRVRQAMDYRKYLPRDPFRKDVELLIEIALAPVLEIFAAATPMAALQERQACIEDIQDALGNWGGPEHEHYTQAMHRSIDAIQKRAKGLDLWGRPAAAQPQRESEPRQCSCPIERCDGPKSANEYCTAHPPKQFERESEQPEQAWPDGLGPSSEEIVRGVIAFYLADQRDRAIALVRAALSPQTDSLSTQQGGPQHG